MSPDAFKTARATLGLSSAGLGALMQTDARTIRRYEAGDREIPGPVIVLMAALLDGWRPKPSSPSAPA